MKIRCTFLAVLCMLFFSDKAFPASYNYYLPRYVSNSGYWTGVGLKDGNISYTASVTATVYESTGTVLATESKSIDPRGQAAFMVGSGLNKEGWVKVTSNEPLTGLGFIAMADGDKLMFDIPFVSEPATTLYVPHVAQDATWDTIVYVCNPHKSETTMYLTFIDSEGSVVRVSHGHIIPANGSGSYPLSALLGDDSYTSGSVRITASLGVAAFALYHNLKTGDRSYAGINAEIPQATGSASYSYYLPYALADADYWTGVGLRNESAADSASVTVTGIRKNGTAFGSQTKTIPFSGQTAFMMSPGEGWVKITSDQPLTGLGFIAMTHDDKLMFDIPFVSEPATALYVPHVAQDATWDTIVYVCNPHGSATTLYLTLVRSDGTVVVSQPYALSINASGAYPLSAIVGGGTYTSGSVEITASQGVAAFALYHNLKTGARSYAGISAVPCPQQGDLPYDGQWSGSATSVTVNCETATIEMTITDSVISGTAQGSWGETYELYGDVYPDGTIEAAMAGSDEEYLAQYSGQLTENTGSGTWQDIGGCSGTWELTRQSP